MINFKPKKFQKTLNDGEYFGTVNGLKYFEGKGYFVLDLLMDDVIFSTPIFENNPAFNNFLFGYVTPDGLLDETKLVGVEVSFEIRNFANDNETKSRIVAIKATETGAETTTDNS